MSALTASPLYPRAQGILQLALLTPVFPAQCEAAHTWVVPPSDHALELLGDIGRTALLNFSARHRPRIARFDMT